MKFDPTETWLENIALENSDSEETYSKYKRNFNRFLELVEKSAREILVEYEESRDRKFRRKYAKAIKIMTAQMHKEGYAGSTISGQVSAVKSFFKFHDLPLGYTPQANDDVVYHNRSIERNEIAEILKVSKPREQAFFSIMAQSGLRPSTICSLKIGDVEGLAERNCPIPATIQISAEKTKGKYKSYFTFIGKESVEYLYAYLNTREHTKPDDYLFTDRGETKPLNRGSVTHTFKRIADKLCRSGVLDFEIRDGKNKPSELRMYSLRKYFRKMGGHAGADFVDFWMGHEADYRSPHIPASDSHYFDTDDIEYHRRKYKNEALPHLTILEETATETQQLVKKLEARSRKYEQYLFEISGFLMREEDLTDEDKERIRKIYEEMRKHVGGYSED